MRSALIVLLTSSLISVSCTDDNEAFALTQFRELRSTLIDHTRVFFEAAQQGDTARLRRLGGDSAIASVQELAQGPRFWVDPRALAKMEDLTVVTEITKAAMKYSIESMWFYVFFEYDQERWKVAHVVGPVMEDER